MNSQNGLDFFTIIADRSSKKELLSMISVCGARGICTIYGHGSVNTSVFIEAFGFAPEKHKVIIQFLVPRPMTDTILNHLVSQFDFDKPNTGIAFTVRVEGLSF